MCCKARVVLSVAVLSVCAVSAAAAPSVNVSMSFSEDVLGIGQTRTFSVLASVANPAGSLEGVFRIVPGSIVQPGFVRQWRSGT